MFVCVFQWSSSPMNDFYADSILAEILKVDLEWNKLSATTPSGGGGGGSSASKSKPPHLAFREALVATLCDMFAECSVVEETQTDDVDDNDDDDSQQRLTMRMDNNKSVRIDLGQLSVSCDEDKQLEQSVVAVLKQVSSLY